MFWVLGGQGLSPAEAAAISSFIALGTTPPGFHLAKDASGFFVNTPDTGSGGGVAIGTPVTGGTAGSILYVDGSGALAQDNTVFFWDDTNNRLILGANALDHTASTANINVVKTGLSFVNAYGYGIAGASGGFFTGYAANGTPGSPTAVLAGTTLVALSGRGFDGTNWTTGSQGSIVIAAAEAWGATARGTNITFNTTPIGSTTNTGVAVMSSVGNFAIGTTAAQIPRFSVVGTRSAAFPAAGANTVVFDSTFTDTSSSGTVGTMRSNTYGIPTFAASSATTYTVAANLFIGGAPVAGTNVTITNPYAVYVSSGNSYFGGTILANYATANTVAIFDASKNLVSASTATYPSLTELSYLKGVTSPVQTQLDSKVTGPASATDNAIARYDTTTGKLIQNSAASVSDAGLLTTASVRLGATGTTNILVTDGDSITEYNVYQPLLSLTETFSIQNTAVSGRTLQQMQEAAFTSVDPLYSTKNRYNVDVIFGGTNNFYFSQSLAETYDSLLAYCASRRLAGYKVIVVTMMSRVGTGLGGATLDSFKNSYNAIIRARWPEFADGLADVASNPNLGADGAYANLTYFTDGVHPTTAGYTIIAGIISNTINRLTDGFVYLPNKTAMLNNSSLLGETTTLGTYREMVTIDSNNKLRIGSAAGGDDAYVTGGLQVLGGLVSPGGTGGFELEYVGGTAYVTAYNRSAGWIPMIHRAENIAYLTNGVQRMFIDGSGNVGINTGAPTAKLDVKGDSTTDGPTLGADLLGTAGWTPSGTITGDNTAGWNFGATDSTLTHTFTPTIGSFYEFTVLATAGSSQQQIVVSYGAIATATLFPTSTSTTRFGWKATTATPLVITGRNPSSTVLLTFEIQEVTAPSAPVKIVRNSAGTITSETRASIAANNIFEGLNSGRYNLRGITNTTMGANTMQESITNSTNTAIGRESLRDLGLGDGNVAVNSFTTLRKGSNNTGVGSSLENGSTNVMIRGTAQFANGSVIIGSTAGTNTYLTNSTLINSNVSAAGGSSAATGQAVTTLTAGVTYTILNVGTTDFTLIGARENLVGASFVATAAGTGTGTATRTSFGVQTSLLINSSTTNVHSFNSTFLRSASANALSSIGVSGVIAINGAMGSPVNNSSIAGATMQVSKTYRIITVGTTDFTLVGAPENRAGIVFIATGASTGTGTVNRQTAGGIALGIESQRFITGLLGETNISVGDYSLKFDRLSASNLAIGYFAASTHTRMQRCVTYGEASMGYQTPTTSTAGRAAITSANIKANGYYEISVLGTTDFTLIGASSNTVGVRFFATGVGAGTGTALEIPYGSVAMGTNVLRLMQNTRFTVGIGDDALSALTNAMFVTATGALAGADLTTGDNNTFNGYNTGRGVTTGRANTILGANVTGLSATLSNNIILADGDGVIRMQTISTGQTGFGVAAPTAWIHIQAGTATASTAPLKFTAGTALTTPEDGAMEYHGSHLYFTIGSTRYQIDQQSGGGAFNGARTYKSAVQSIGTTLTAVIFDTESYDTNTYHDNTTNNTRLTVPSTGYYRITGLLNTDANAVARVGIRLNGTTYIGSIAAGNAGASLDGGALITTEYNLTAGDYVELMGYFGSTQNTKSGLNGPTFSIQYLG